MSSQAIAPEAPAASRSEANLPDPGQHCDECNSDEVVRIFRKGFLEEKIYPLLGFYPWRCKRCGLRLMMRERGIGEQAELHAINRLW